MLFVLLAMSALCVDTLLVKASPKPTSSKSTSSLQKESPPFITLNYDFSSISLKNWNNTENRHWAWCHMGEIFPFPVEIWKGMGPVHQFGKKNVDFSDISITYYGKKRSLQEFLILSRTDGFLVLKGNNIVYEVYPRTMKSTDRHTVMSSSKSIVALLMGELVEQGLIDLNKKVKEYVPEIGSAYAEATIQNVLDMNVAMNYREDYSDPASEGMKIFSAEGFREDYTNWPGGVLQFLKTLTSDDIINSTKKTLYNSANTSLLAIIISRATGKTYNRCFQESAYKHIGAEQNALGFEDVTGTSIGSGIVAFILRDFARFAQIFTNKGVSGNGKRIMSKSWVERVRNNPNATIYGYGTRNKWKSSAMTICHENGGWAHLGYGGQVWYANIDTGVTIVKLSTLDMPAGIDSDTAHATLDVCDIISEKLSRL